MNRYITVLFIILLTIVVFPNVKIKVHYDLNLYGDKSNKSYLINKNNVHDSTFVIKSKQLIKGANKIIKKNLLPKDFNGTFLIALNGEVIFNYCRGYVNYDTKEKIDSLTPLHVASITKTFTSMGILRLHQFNKLSIYDPVAKYLEIFPFDNITIFDLLCHRSGIIDYEYYINRFWKNKDAIMTNDDIIDYLPNICQIKFYKPQQKFVYSNTNFAILALIIEKVSGMSYKDYMQVTFFEPLKMTNTFVFKLQDSISVHPSYYSNKKAIPFNFKDGIIGDKGIYSCSNDLLKWDQALYDKNLFPDSICQLAFESYSIIRKRRKKRNKQLASLGYGLGWRLKNIGDPEKKIIYHNGWWHGNKSMLVRRQSDHLTIIALSNKYSNAIYSLNKLLVTE